MRRHLHRVAAVRRVAVLRHQADRLADRLRAGPRPAATAAESTRRLAVARGTHISVSQASMRPSASARPRASSSCGGPFGSQPSSSSRAPLHAHRLADRLGQQRRIGGGVVVAVHAVAAGAVEIDHAHLVARQVEQRARSVSRKRWVACDAVQTVAAVGGRRPPRTTVPSTRATGSASSSSADDASCSAAQSAPRASPFLHERLVGDERAPARPVAHGRRAPISARRRSSAPSSSRAARTASHSSAPTTPTKSVDAHDAHAGQSRATDGVVDRQHLRADGGRPHARGRAACRATLEVVHVDVAAGDLGRHVGPRQRLADDHVDRGIAAAAPSGSILTSKRLPPTSSADADAGAVRPARTSPSTRRVPSAGTAAGAPPSPAAPRAPWPRPGASATPPRMTPLLPAVGPWLGVSAVSPSISSMRSTPMPSSSRDHLPHGDASARCPGRPCRSRSSPCRRR